MKKLFFISLLLTLGACKFATEPPLPIIPPDSIVITSVTIEVTATTAVIKTTVTTSKSTTVSFEYGVNGYTNTTNATPNPVNGSMSVSAKISDLTPNTTYKYRIKTVGSTTNYFNDSTFTTLPIIPPDSIVITSVTIEVTATTAVIKTMVTTSKSTSIFFEYGVSNYTNTISTTPNPVNGSMSVSAKISDLTPNTTYKYRIKTVGSTTNYFNDSTFTTSSQLQVGDEYKKGIVIEVHTANGIQHGLLAAPVDLTPIWGIGMNYFAATEAAAKYAEGYRLPDTTEMKLVKNAKNLGILTNFVDPNYDSRGIYFTSTEEAGNKDWVFIVEMYGYEKVKYIIHKNSSASSRAVCSF